jgi:hypothetical protein
VHRLGILSDGEAEPTEPAAAGDRTDDVEGTAPPQEPQADWQALKAEMEAQLAADTAKGTVEDSSQQPPSLMHSLERFRQPVLVAAAPVLVIVAAVLASWWLGGDSALPQSASADGLATALPAVSTAQPADAPGRPPLEPTTGPMITPALPSAPGPTAAAPVAGDTAGPEITVTPTSTDPEYQQQESALEIPLIYEESFIDQDDPDEIFDKPAMPDTLPAETQPEAPASKGEKDLSAGPLALPSNVELTCVFFGLDDPVAIINGRCLEVGDQIESVKIISIEESSVEVEYQGRRFTMGLGSPTSD